MCKPQSHCHHNYYVVVPEGVDKNDFELEIQFKNQADVLKGKVCSGKLCVMPVWKLRYPD